MLDDPCVVAVVMEASFCCALCKPLVVHDERAAGVEEDEEAA